jgi:hypothetical protein
VTSTLLLDMLRAWREARQKTPIADGNLGPRMRPEIERTLSAHDARRGR